MTIEISTGLKNKLLASSSDFKEELALTTISLGDGDGTGGRDTINDSAGGLGVFTKHSWIKIVPPKPDPNRNIFAKVLSSSANQIEVAADTLTALAAGTKVFLVEFDIGGSFASIFRNSTIHFFGEDRPVAGADASEPGSPILKVTLNGSAFTPGTPENGLNFGDMVGSVLRRAIDPETTAQEIWRGNPISATQAKSCRVYTNDVITGTSVSACRFDCAVSGPGGGADCEISPSPLLTVGTPVDVTQVRVELKATALA